MSNSQFDIKGVNKVKLHENKTTGTSTAKVREVEDFEGTKNVATGNQKHSRKGLIKWLFTTVWGWFSITTSGLAVLAIWKIAEPIFF